MGSKTWLIAGCAVAAIVAVALWGTWQSHQDAAPTTVHTSSPNQTTAMANAPSVAPQPQLKAPAPTPTELKVSKAAQFDEYAKANTPTDRFRAYLLAQNCIWAMEHQRNAEMTPPGERNEDVRRQLEGGEFRAKVETACGDLKDTQLLARRKYVEEAAEAGFPMAAIYLSAEGPFGDPRALVDRPNDPAVLQWRSHIVDLLKLAASKGDTAAMTSLSNMYASGSGVIEGRDPVKALEYWAAIWNVQKKTTGKTSPETDQRMEVLSRGLTAEQIEAAKRAGHLLALGGEK